MRNLALESLTLLGEALDLIPKFKDCKEVSLLS